VGVRFVPVGQPQHRGEQARVPIREHCARLAQGPPLVGRRLIGISNDPHVCRALTILAEEGAQVVEIRSARRTQDQVDVAIDLHHLCATSNQLHDPGQRVLQQRREQIRVLAP
jgi:hypothetical protein